MSTFSLLIGTSFVVAFAGPAILFVVTFAKVRSSRLRDPIVTPAPDSSVESAIVRGVLRYGIGRVVSTDACLSFDGKSLDIRILTRLPNAPFFPRSTIVGAADVEAVVFSKIRESWRVEVQLRGAENGLLGTSGHESFRLQTKEAPGLLQNSLELAGFPLRLE